MSLSPHPADCAVRGRWFVALAALRLGTAFAVEPPSTITLVPQTHVLFMGVDLDLEKDKEFHRVEDVTAGGLIIKSRGKPVKVPQSRELNFLIHESLKLASTSVGIARLKAERAYTAAADPFRKLAHASNLAANQSAAADLARGQGLLLRMAGAEKTGDPGMQAELQRADGAVDSANLESSRQIYDVGSHAVESGVEEARELFDAIRLTFEVTPEKNLAQPYYAIIAQIRERGSRSDQTRSWAYVKSLDAMRAGEPKKVTVFEGGLPPGYILENYEVHFYDRGQELATNLSHKRIPISNDEALEYQIIEYVGAHKGRTLPAALLTTTLSNEVREPLTSAQLNRPCSVRVAKSGRVVAAYRDAAGKEPLSDATLESALKALRFKPALEAGRPVESVIPINLGQLFSGLTPE